MCGTELVTEYLKISRMSFWLFVFLSKVAAVGNEVTWPWSPNLLVKLCLGWRLSIDGSLKYLRIYLALKISNGYISVKENNLHVLMFYILKINIQTRNGLSVTISHWCVCYLLSCTLKKSLCLYCRLTKALMALIMSQYCSHAVLPCMEEQQWKL